MSATINTGWLKGKNGVKFAPKTLSSQVITNDGIALEEKIAADLNEIKTYIDETVSGNEGSGSHDHNDTYYTEAEIDSMLSTTASTIKNDLLNGAGEAYDTLKELGELIDENTDAIEALELIATNKMDKNNSVGTGAFSLNRKGDIGENSVAIGNEVTASGQYSYAEGSSTTASGKASHAEGIQTTAASEAQHVQGRYNIIDEEGVYLHIVGNGITDKTIGKQRSNAHTLDWDGNAEYAGDVIAHGCGGENPISLIELANKINSGSTGNTGGTSSSNGTASDVSYDDQQTQLGVNNVQDAIGELAELFKSLSLSYSNNILYLSLNGVVISSCTIVPTVVGSISLDNIISIDNLQSGVYTLKYENDESILDGVENICELEVF